MSPVVLHWPKFRCEVSAIGSTSSSFARAGGTGSFSVTVNGSHCGWSGSTLVKWITVTTASGTGSGTVEFSVASNGSRSARSGTITVGGFTHTVSQAA